MSVSSTPVVLEPSARARSDDAAARARAVSGAGAGAGTGARARLLVCVGAAPTSASVIHAAHDMADEAHAPWVAAWVESPLTPLTDRDRLRLDAHLKLCERLGARIVRLSGSNVADALLEYAHDENIDHIVVGRPHGASWRDLARGRLVSQLLRRAADSDLQIHVVAARTPRPPRPRDEAERALGKSKAKTKRKRAVLVPRLIAAAALVGAATLVTWSLGLTRLAEADVVLAYLVVITIAAVRFGTVASIVAAALSVAAFDFFFVPPFYTFTVADSRHVLTFAMMFVVGVFVSAVAARLKAQEAEASARERRTQSVLALTKATAAAQEAKLIAQALAEHASAALQRETAVLLPTARGELVSIAAVGLGGMQKTELEAAQHAYRNGRAAGRGTDTLPHSVMLAIPLLAQDREGAAEGVLVVLMHDDSRAVEEHDHEPLHPVQRELVDAFAGQAGAALQRLRLADEARRAALSRRTEEMRSSLLSAVSHDLRTPLASITGAATTLLESGARLSDDDRRALLTSITDQGFALEKLVASLLDMTRVESGALVLRREWVPVDELVGSALARTNATLHPRVVATHLSDVPLLYVDPILFEQVLINLLDNAAKHTPPTSRLDVTARQAASAADALIEIIVSDDGPGLPEGIDVFEKFVRGPSAKSASVGLGLGLAICKSIVVAHGGTITATNRTEGGAQFRIELPMPPTAPGATNEVTS